MTPVESILTAPIAAMPSNSGLIAPANGLQSIVVCWQSQGAERINGRRVFVMTIEILNDAHAMVEAWIEHGSNRSEVLARQQLRIEATCDDGLSHIDIFGNNGDGRIAAITLRADRLLYAQTSLLKNLKHGAANYDSPSLQSSSNSH